MEMSEEVDEWFQEGPQKRMQPPSLAAPQTLNFLLHYQLRHVEKEEMGRELRQQDQMQRRQPLLGVQRIWRRERVGEERGSAFPMRQVERNEAGNESAKEVDEKQELEEKGKVSHGCREMEEWQVEDWRHPQTFWLAGQRLNLPLLRLPPLFLSPSVGMCEEEEGLFQR